MALVNAVGSSDFGDDLKANEIGQIDIRRHRARAMVDVTMVGTKRVRRFTFNSYEAALQFCERLWGERQRSWDRDLAK